MAEQLIYLAPGEGLPGFPSGHGPGWYLVDYEARTIRPAPVEIPDQPMLAEQPTNALTPPVEPSPGVDQTEENQGG